MSLSGVIKSTNDISCVLYPQDYLASLKKRFPEFIQNTDEELMAILKNAPVRKEIEYEMDFTLAELKRILHESTVENKSEDIDKRLGSLSPTRNERIQLLL